MTQNVRLGILAIIVLVFIWLLTQMSQLGSDNEKLQKDLMGLEKNAAHFAQLKKRWHKKTLKKELLAKLSKVKKFDKHFSKNSHDVIVYKGLTSSLLDKVSYIIFASDLILVDVKMEKKGEIINLEVEMK